jgi:hypothetical protein
MSVKEHLSNMRGTAKSLGGASCVGRRVFAAACAVAVALLVGGSGLAAEELLKSHDGKVLQVDVRQRALVIEYPGAKDPVTVLAEAASLEDFTGRAARVELFKPGTPVKLRVKEVTVPRPDPKNPAAPPVPVVEKVIKEVRMASAPSAPGAATAAVAAAAGAVSAGAAAKPVTGAPVASTASAKPAPVPGALPDELAGPPPELAAISLPAGKAIQLSLAGTPEFQEDTCTLRLKCHRGSSSATDVQPDSAAVFYVTEDANLSAGETDFAGPVGTVGKWRDLLTRTNTFIPFTGHNAEHEVSAAVGKFDITVPLKERRITVSGTLRAPPAKLSPKVMAVVLMNGSAAISNVLWFRIEKPAAPAPGPKPGLVAPAPGPAPAVAPKPAPPASAAPTR